MTRAASYLDDMPLMIPSRALTHDGFRQWAVSDDFPEHGKISFIDHGVILDMSPEDIALHNTAKTEITAVIATFVRNHKLGMFYSDRSLLSNRKAGLSTEPDAMFARWETLESKRLVRVKAKGHSEGIREVLGTPDWVLEVVSPSTIKKDTQLLREAYHRAGIAEYWIVNALEKELKFDMLVRQPGGYAPVEPKAGWRRSPVFARRFKLTRERNRIGDWSYTLHVGR